MKYLVIATLLVCLSFQGVAQTAHAPEYKFSIGLQTGAWKGFVFGEYRVSPSLQVVTHTHFLDVGLLGGFRHRAYGNEFDFS